MPNSPNRLSRFWQELKRRKVIYVITVYATAAFVIIELVNNLTEPLNLPSNLATIVIIVLAVGFPLAVVLSWLYDLTGEGVEKTRPLSKIWEKEEKSKIPIAWKIATYVSFVVIIGLVTFNIVGGSGLLRAGGIKKILILPIENYTGDDQLDDFISGMHSVLITDVGRISGLRTISKITSVAYADKPVTQIADELGVDAIVQPVIMCLADSICFQMKIDSPEEEQLWVADYREPKSQLYNFGNRLTKDLAEEVKVKLTADEERVLAETRIADPDAYDAWVTGQNYWDQLNKEDLELARMYFERAIEIDPDWAPPYAGLSITWGVLASFGGVPDSIAFPKQYEYLNKALELDSTDSFVQYSVALPAVWGEWNWKKGEKAFVKSLELNPNDAKCRMYYAHLLTILRRSEEALHQAKLAMELDPLNPLIMGLYVVVLQSAEECQEALNYIEKAISLDPNHNFLTGQLLGAYLCLEDYERAFEEWKRINVDFWEKFGVTELLETTFHERGWIAFMEELTRLNKGVMAQDIPHLNRLLYGRYLALGEYDRAMDYLEILYEDHSQDKDINLPYQSAKPVYEKLKDNPRYIAFLKKMNLPTE